MKLPIVKSREICAQSNIFKVERMQIEFSNGSNVEYERLVGSKTGAVLVVAINDDGKVLMIKEYAAGVGRYELALPKGKIDPNETVVEAANRELMEEIGFGANNLNHFTSYSIAPGYLSHHTHIVLAQDLYPKKLIGDEPEPIIVEAWDFKDLTKMVSLPYMTEARSIAALYQVRDMLGYG